MNTTYAEPPTLVPSDEATEQELQLAREQGIALQKAVVHMLEEEAHGREVIAGDYLVGCAVEDAEGLYEPNQAGELTWHEAGKENAHIEISVRDAADGRFLPGLSVRLTVLDSSGREIGTHDQPYLWHPWLYHYGRNWEVPGNGQYTLRVHVDAPKWSRHDRRNGQRFTEPVDVEFRGMKIETGQKHSRP